MRNLISLCILASAAAPLLAQNAVVEDFRERLEQVPFLPFERVEIEVSPSVSLEGLSAVSLDAQGLVYVLHRPETGDPVVVLDADGNFVRSWGEGMFGIPHGIRVDPDGNVWTVDSNTSKVYKFTPLGEQLLDIDVGDIPDASRRFCGAADITFGDGGRIFVGDGYCNGRIVEYDQEGKKVGQWGSVGTGPGEFDHVHSVAMSPEGHIYVADRENGRIQWFDTNGEYLGQWNYAGLLFAVAFSPSGELYASVALPETAEKPWLGNVIKIDRDTGEMLGRIDAFAHELAFGPGGALYPASRRGYLLAFRPR